MAPARLGTRRSTMATTQSQQVADAITARTGVAVELKLITSYGDITRAHLTQLGGTGVFVNNLRDELLSGGIDFAVHSLKDLPTAPAEGLTVIAVTERDDPRDALCARDGRKFSDLPAGATVGTGSPRRVAQLAALRPDLSYVPIRGNAETRLGKVTSGELDAVVLAYAGLARVGRLDDVTDVFEAEQVLPAPGQGALAVECLAERAAADLAYLTAVDHGPTRAAVTAERTVLAELEAGCAAPVGAYAECHDGRLLLRAAVVAPDGGQAVRRERGIALGQDTDPVEAAASLGRELAREMIGEGADRIVADAAGG
ncbi:hydroxymethylbilane synthase [Streptomonospora nanhaiensis]|uniref:Porphobilinogen deaminase n=1 Tax=Streptomonospora nanhaiensis TaxID=1323731 RepID=A0A853BPR6_9ACTN|nr:hydroxymethylbilane synthase [Streptomonospora nanhaiensis]MBV2365967.1 hydroxymethylbilane synthase [Streptomonospora nanhaiensis]MBX9388855.1 hydroxymethylbilane synthase [Streptomonospora nanhaiensis]NYI96597.1 hydroxymethylbilane synthase [Streptomonospora nanhaiensis]